WGCALTSHVLILLFGSNGNKCAALGYQLDIEINWISGYRISTAAQSSPLFGPTNRTARTLLTPLFITVPMQNVKAPKCHESIVYFIRLQTNAARGSVTHNTMDRLDTINRVYIGVTYNAAQFSEYPHSTT